MNIFTVYTSLLHLIHRGYSTNTDLSATVFNLCKQIEPMANSYCWLSRQKTNSHQCQADPRQPVLARLTVCVEESPNSLRSGEKGMRDHLYKRLIINQSSIEPIH